MSVQYSTGVRINMLDSIETTIGANAKLVFYTGAKPTTCADAASGTVVATLSLTGAGGDWMSAASAASNVVTKDKNPASAWSVAASNAGTVGHYRIYDSSLTTCHEQGTVTTTAVGTGDITLDNTVVTAGQTITITGKTITAGNA